LKEPSAQLKKPLATINFDMDNVRQRPLQFPNDNETGHGSRNIRRVITLLALAALINYIDRGNLSIAASLLKRRTPPPGDEPGIRICPTAGNVVSAITQASNSGFPARARRASNNLGTIAIAQAPA